MKKKLIILSGAIVLLAIILCISLNLLTRKTADWSFIQSVGGIKIEKPLETEDGYYLPVTCNVSGWDSITIKPTVVNSAIFCIKTKATVDENKIYLTVIKGISIFGGNDSKSKSVRIGSLKKGNYKVYYKDKLKNQYPVGEFTIE